MLATGQGGLVRRYGKAFMRLGWWEMLCAARSVLPEDVICFDSRFARCDTVHVCQIYARCLDPHSHDVRSTGIVPQLARYQQIVGA